MPDNYEHYISKNIQAFYRRRLFSPMIYLVLLAVLWIVFPLGAMLRPAQLSDNTKIADAYKDHHRYVRMTFTDLKFSGVAVLNMHAPWEIISKVDLYEALHGYVAFLKEA